MVVREMAIRGREVFKARRPWDSFDGRITQILNRRYPVNEILIDGKMFELQPSEAMAE